jgi:thiol-disulfide isomerase/thioredoxin
MKRKSLWISLGVACLVVATLTGLYMSATESARQQNAAEMQRRKTEDKKPEEKKDVETTDKKEPKESPAPTPSSPGKYTDYSSNIIAETSGTKVLFFHAPWCPQCRMLEADIKQTALPDNLTIIKVDYDSNQSLRQKYGVTLQTTLVLVDDNGNLVKKYVAYNEPTYESIKENLLDS